MKLTKEEKIKVKNFAKKLVEKKVLKEATDFDINDLPKGGILTFKDGETWKVIKPIGNSSSPRGYVIAPYGETKNYYISLHIEITMDKLSDDLISVT